MGGRWTLGIASYDTARRSGGYAHHRTDVRRIMWEPPTATSNLSVGIAKVEVAE